MLGPSGATRHPQSGQFSGGGIHGQETPDDDRTGGRRHVAGRRMRDQHRVADAAARPRRRASAPAASASAARERRLRRPRRGGRARRSRPATPSWTRHSAPTSRSTARRSRSRPSGSAARATNFAAARRRLRAATGIDDPGRQHRLEPRDRAARRASRAGSRRTWRCSPSRRPSWPTPRTARSSTSRRSWMPRSSAMSIRPPSAWSPQGAKHLGHPVQGRRQVDHLVPDQGLRGQGLHGPHDVGRADRPVRQDRRRRRQPVVRQRGRPRRRDRLADHRLGRGSGPQDQGPRRLQRLDQPQDHVPGPGHQGRLRQASARSSSRPSYVFGGNTAIVATDQKTPMDPMFTDDLASPKCWMQKIPTWYGPDFFPDQRANAAAVQVHHR